MTNIVMPDALVTDLIAKAASAAGALSGANDDLNRAALILRQVAGGASQRLRRPEDYRRIADQFSNRARACTAVESALIAACRAAMGLPVL